MKVEIYKNSKTSGYVELVNHLGDDVLTPVNAARVSFLKESIDISEKDIKLLNYCAKENHSSIFEHNICTFKFKVPLFVARQHMRHRTWSYNEVSRRYTSANMEFYEPKFFRSQHAKNRQASNSDKIDPVVNSIKGSTLTWTTGASEAIKEHDKRSYDLFCKLLKAGVCREQARMVLGQNLYTQYIATVNLMNLVKFIKLRDHEGAQKEIQEVAIACKTIIESIWPITTQALFKVRKDK